MKDTTIVKVSRSTPQRVGRDLHLVAVFSGMNVVEARPVAIRDELTMGRTILPSLGLTTPDSTMSRHHFRLQRPSKEVIGALLADCGGNVSALARRLGKRQKADLSLA